MKMSMWKHSRVAALLQHHYNIRPISIVNLQAHAIDGRGIWRIDAADNRRYVLRMMRGDAGAWLDQPARMLQCLQSVEFPAPRVWLSSNGSRVVSERGWWALLIDFVDGALASPSPPLLHRLAATTRRLHQLVPPASEPLPGSWKDPQNAIPVALDELEQARQGLPAELDAIAAELQASLRLIYQQCDALPRCIVHGDCWHNNAIAIADGEIVLIDWDGAGWGTPMIDLGELLLTCHYDPTQPTVIDVDEHRIAAILGGYGAREHLTQPERDLLLPAIRYTLAFHAADWLRDQQAWPRFVVRFNATAAITDVADRVLGRG
jgi:Ser/Thr protein kinase RdoA (MazF antagonist)